MSGEQTIQCTVLFFAQVRDVVARDRLEIELPTGSTVRDLRQHLITRFPTIADQSQHLAVAVNVRYAADSTKLHRGDVVALIPPVSGG